MDDVERATPLRGTCAFESPASLSDVGCARIITSRSLTFSCVLYAGNSNARPPSSCPGEPTTQTHCSTLVTFKQFQVLLTSFSGFLFIFPSRYLFAIGLSAIFSFRWNLPPTLSCNPKQLDSVERFRTIPTMVCPRGYHSLWRSVPGTLDKLSWIWNASARLQFFREKDFNDELFPFHSPLLGES